MSGTDPAPISLILDTTAVLAFAAGSMHVHEPIIVAAETGEHVGVPVTCLIAAARRDPEADLQELVRHRQIVILRPEPAEEDLLLDWTLYYDGRQDAAAAAVASYRRGQCCVLTGEPEVYAIGGHRPDWVVAIDGKTSPADWDLPDHPTD